MPAQVRQKVGDLYQTFTRSGFTIYDRMKAEGLPNLSALIEEEDPTPLRDRLLGVDGFTRMLEVADIRTVSDRYGTIRADEVGEFFTEPNRPLFPELCRRLWAAGSVDNTVRQQQQQELLADLRYAEQSGEKEVGDRALAQYLSVDIVPGTIQRPYNDSLTDYTAPLIVPSIPLTELIARTRGNDGTTYRKRVLTAPAAQDIRMLRVTEAAELPKAAIKEASRLTRLYKFGRALEASYEALRRLPIDEFAMHVRMLRLQTEVDQVAAALDTAVNGDGNGGTAATVYTKATLDAAMTINVLSLRGWLAFKLLWANPYQLTTILANQDVILDLMMLNIGTANVLLANNPVPGLLGQPLTQLTPINARFADGVRFGVTPDAPARQIIGFDNRFAVEHITENNSDISESERYVTRQTEVLTFSMNEGYAILDQGSVKIFNLNA